MKDKWMNIGYESDELMPYHQPETDLNDELRIRKSTNVRLSTLVKLFSF